MSYYLNNKDRLLKQSKERYERNKENPDFMRLRNEKARMKSTEEKLLVAAKRRAFLKGLDFDLEVSDIQIPDKCPILKTSISPNIGRVSAASPSLDRIDPSLGYVKTNIWVISHKANSMKNNADVASLKTFAKWVGNAYGED